MGWFLLRNTQWTRSLLKRWALTREFRKGDYVQIRQVKSYKTKTHFSLTHTQCCGGDDQPSMLDLILHEIPGRVVIVHTVVAWLGSSSLSPAPPFSFYYYYDYYYSKVTTIPASTSISKSSLHGSRTKIGGG